MTSSHPKPMFSWFLGITVFLTGLAWPGLQNWVNISTILIPDWAAITPPSCGTLRASSWTGQPSSAAWDGYSEILMLAAATASKRWHLPLFFCKIFTHVHPINLIGPRSQGLDSARYSLPDITPDATIIWLLPSNYSINSSYGMMRE